MSDVTFRDFAGAVMGGDAAAAAGVLQQLLELGPEGAEAATTHFRARMEADGPAFLATAMSLRGAVTSGTDEEIAALLRDCFGLADTTDALRALRARYPRPA